MTHKNKGQTRACEVLCAFITLLAGLTKSARMHNMPTLSSSHNSHDEDLTIKTCRTKNTEHAPCALHVRRTPPTIPLTAHSLRVSIHPSLRSGVHCRVRLPGGHPRHSSMIPRWGHRARARARGTEDAHTRQVDGDSHDAGAHRFGTPGRGTLVALSNLSCASSSSCCFFKWWSSLQIGCFGALVQWFLWVKRIFKIGWSCEYVKSEVGETRESVNKGGLKKKGRKRCVEIGV